MWQGLHRKQRGAGGKPGRRSQTQGALLSLTQGVSPSPGLNNSMSPALRRRRQVMEGSRPVLTTQREPILENKANYSFEDTEHVTELCMERKPRALSESVQRPLLTSTLSLQINWKKF